MIINIAEYVFPASFMFETCLRSFIAYGKIDEWIRMSEERERERESKRKKEVDLMMLKVVGNKWGWQLYKLSIINLIKSFPSPALSSFTR
jgi:hypothetical protein